MLGDFPQGSFGACTDEEVAGRMLMTMKYAVVAAGGHQGHPRVIHEFPE
jgi:hypothetical protein